MIVPLTADPGGPARHLLFVSTPALWPAWPFLPVVRRDNPRRLVGIVTLSDVLGAFGIERSRAAG